MLSESSWSYTRALFSAIPVPDPKYERNKKVEHLVGEPPSPIDPPSGCRFHPRCKYAMDVCKEKEPLLKDVGGDRSVACWLY